MKMIFRECLGCGYQATHEDDLKKFVKDKYKVNNYYTKSLCKKCNAKNAMIKKSGTFHGPFLIKRCNDCKSLAQSIDDMKNRFVKDKACKYGYSNLCKLCNSKRAQNHAKENPGIFRERKRRYIVGQYGISYEKYQQILINQNNCCAICKTNFETNKDYPHIDHDHSCCPTSTKSCGTCVRGLLCRRCNMFLGAVADDIMILESAIKYLKEGESN